MAWYDRFMQQGQVNTKPTQLPDWWGIGRQVGADMQGIRQGEEDAQKKQTLQAAINEAFAENKKAGGNESALYSLIAQKTINIDPEYSQKYSALANSTRYSEAQTNPDKVTLSELGKQLMIERRQLQGNINHQDFPNLSGDQQAALKNRLALVDAKLKESDPIYFASIGGDASAPIAPQGAPIAPTGEPSAVVPAATVADAFPAEIETKIKAAQDSKRTGQMDDTASIISAIDAWALKTGKGAKDREVKLLRDLVENKNKELKEAEDYRKYKDEKGRQAVMDERSFKQQQFTNYKDKVPLWSALKKVEANPSDDGSRRNLFALYLKDLSGAGVTESERIQTTLNMLPAKKREELVGWGESIMRNVAGGMIGKDQVDRQLLEKISGSIDPSVLMSMIKGSFTTEGVNWLESNTQGKKTAADPGNYKQPKEGSVIQTPYGTGTAGKGGAILFNRTK